MPLYAGVRKPVVINEDDLPAEFGLAESKQSTTIRPKMDIVWRNVVIASIAHIFAVYGLYLLVFKVLWTTVFYVYFILLTAMLGITAGLHRLWTHRSYKARLPLQILLLGMSTLAFLHPVITWVRDHRVHHKYADTDADPYNAQRGFFFAHMGWALVRKHPDVTTKGTTVDISDVMNDSLLIFQKRYYMSLGVLIAFVIPAFIPILWGETLWNGVNTVAHVWGARPYDKNIYPVENKFISWITCGEGFHNFHHIFPWDYKAGELGGYAFNITKLFIEIMAAIGWAYDLKTVSADVVMKRVQRTGDGSYSK